MKPNDTRLTPPELVAEVAALVGVEAFTLDVAASPGNQVNGEGGLYYALENDDDGLKLPWHGHVWCNPPYSDIAPWCRKAWKEWGTFDSLGLGGVLINPRVNSITMLLPANKTEQRWWQSYVEGRAGVKVRFLAKRRRFLMPDGSPIYARAKDGAVIRNAKGVPIVGSPAFGLVVLHWSRV